MRSNSSMEVSQTIQSSQHVVPSPDGRHIALINTTRLEIRSSTTLHLLRGINVPAQNWTIKWSSTSLKSRSCQRILLFDEEHVRVFDLADEQWTATIKNGSAGMGKIVNAEFGKSKDEVLVFSDLGSKVTVWSLVTRKTIEIRDPKFATKGFAYRARGSIFALLLRLGAQDVLTLHNPVSYELIRSIALPSIDAQNVKWSPDGRWIAVWDTPSMGYKVHIYTADGHLYRPYSGGTSDGIEGLGVKSLEWSPRGDYLAIGGHDRRVTLLSTRTFAPSMFLDHTSTIQLTPGNNVWEEQVAASSSRSYTAVAQPVAPPTASPTQANSDQLPKIGLSTMTFNSDGSMLATRDDTAPTTVWLWDLSKRTAKAVLIQHSPIRSISWHPTSTSLLLIQCTHEENTVYIYDTKSSIPYAAQLPLLKSSGRFAAQWLRTDADKKPALTFSDAGNFLVAWPDGKDVIVRFDDEDGSGGDESEDSLFEILTGRKSPAKKMIDSTEVLVSDVLDEETEAMDDTFMGRGRLTAV